MEAARRLRPDLYPAPPSLPPLLEHVWNAYAEIRISVPPSDMGLIRPISFQDIRAYDELTGANLSPAEVRLVRALDETARAEHQAEQAPNG